MHAVVEVTDSRFTRYWSELFANDPLQNPCYSQTSFGESRRHATAAEFVDRSFVVVAESKPVFACSLTSHIDEQGRRCLGYFGLEASTHVNRHSMQASTNNFTVEAVQLLQHHINHLIYEIKPNLLEYLDPVSCGMMSPVTQLLLDKGARPIVQTTKIIDLTLSEHALRRKISKCQRSLIHRGQRNLAIHVASGEQFSELDAQSLRRIFAEAETAGDSLFTSLNHYEKLIQQEKAFLVQGLSANVPVASALFIHTARTCHFVFGSSVKRNPEQPAMPALIWSALQHSRNLGCGLFEMGRLAHSDNKNSERTQLLSNFGGDSQTRLKVCLAA